jgi:hypothetical protein
MLQLALPNSIRFDAPCTDISSCPISSDDSGQKSQTGRSKLLVEPSYLAKHQAAYDHVSERTRTIRANAEERKKGVIPATPRARQLRKLRAGDVTSAEENANPKSPQETVVGAEEESEGGSENEEQSYSDEWQSEDTASSDLDESSYSPPKNAISYETAVAGRSICAESRECPSLEPATFARHGSNIGKTIIRKFMSQPGPGWAEGQIKKVATKGEQNSPHLYNCNIAFTSDRGGLRPIRLQEAQYWSNDGSSSSISDAPVGSWVMVE